MASALETARKLWSARRWSGAGVQFARAAGQALSKNARDDAAHAWELAGESWRRADRPLSASQAFGLALELLPDDAPQTGPIRIRLASALSDLGELETGLRITTAVHHEATTSAGKATALDGMMDALFALGRYDEARERLEELRGVAGGAAEIAVRFREGQRLRFEGELAEAAARFGWVTSALQGHPEASMGVAAAQMELAEVALLWDDAEDAIKLFGRALELYEEEGRMGASWRAEAGRVRASLELGLDPLLQLLDQGIGEAEFRQLPLLEVELRLARGMASAEGRRTTEARQDLDKALAGADQVGAQPLAGVVRFERARLLRGEDQARIEDLARAEEDLLGNVPWHTRAVLAKAVLLAKTAPPEARELATRTLARFSAMDMSREAQEAKDLLCEL